jgi:hypothetical protein
VLRSKEQSAKEHGDDIRNDDPKRQPRPHGGPDQALSEEPITAQQLAFRTRTDVNFINVWLAQQVNEGFVTYDAVTCRYANYCSWPRN